MFGGGNTIKTADAISAARALIGTPYAQLDCIGLIVRVIRTAPGGDPAYRTAGTNTLWRSYELAGKYRDLTWRQEGIQGARTGMLAFKRRAEDIHHVGLVTGEGTVIHSSSVHGKVVETALDGAWALLGIHRYIGIDDEEKDGEYMSVLYQARVSTKDEPLNVRDSPNQTGRKIGRVERGTLVDVLSEPKEGWLFIRLGDLAGYAASAYLTREDDAGGNGTQEAVEPFTTICREDGTMIRLAGRWRIPED